MIDNQQLLETQQKFNILVYETIMVIYTKVLEEVEAKEALGLVISALATNLGGIIAQIPDEYRMQYAEMTQHILRDSINKSLETMARQIYGQVGHA